MPEIEGLLAILLETRQWLAKPNNDVSGSAWAEAAAALAEVDALLAVLKSGGVLPKTDLERLFAPTGPIQEVSLSSGWGQAFLGLAQRLDRELAQRSG